MVTRNTYNTFLNIPFAVKTSFFALVQLIVSVRLFINITRPEKQKACILGSMIGMVMSVGLGVASAILATQYNMLTRDVSKEHPTWRMIMPFYWTAQVDGTCSFLFSLPIFASAFYFSLKRYECDDSVSCMSKKKVLFFLIMFGVCSLVHLIRKCWIISQ